MSGSMPRSGRAGCSNRRGFGVEYSRVWIVGEEQRGGSVPAMTVSFNCTFDLPVPSGPPLKQTAYYLSRAGSVAVIVTLPFLWSLTYLIWLDRDHIQVSLWPSFVVFLVEGWHSTLDQMYV